MSVEADGEDRRTKNDVELVEAAEAPPEPDRSSVVGSVRDAQGALDTQALAQTIPVSRLESQYTQASEDPTEVGVAAEGEDGKRPRKSFLQRMNPFRWGAEPPVPTERQTSREYTASWPSRMTFQWMAPLMTTGYRRPLEHNDLWLVNPNRSADVMVARLKTNFQRRVDTHSKRPLLFAIYDTFRHEFLLGAACQFVASIIQIVNPYTLRYLISYANQAYLSHRLGTRSPPLGRGLGLVFAILGMQIIQSLGTNHFMYNGMILGGQARAALIAVIFDKAMTVSGRAKAGGRPVETGALEPPAATQPGSEAERKWYKKLLRSRKDAADHGKAKKKGTDKANGKDKDKSLLGDGQGWGNGRIINLMSTDTWRVDQASGFFHIMWTAPIQIILTLILLLVNVSYSALAGYALIAISMPLLGRAIRILLSKRGAINKVTDQRVTLTQEILQAVRFVKFFGWEMSFLDRLSTIRNREIRAIQILLAIRNGINAFSMSMPIFASMLTFITYSLTNHGLDPARVFSSLALFNAIRLPLNFLPYVLGQVIDGISSINRIQEFLLAEDMKDDVSWDYNRAEAIVVENADFTWERLPSQETDDVPSSDANAKKKDGKSRKGQKKGLMSDEKHDTQESSTSGSGIINEGSHISQAEPFKLQNINLSIGRQELLAVIGTVGSGKSSLLSALAGDMRRTNGNVTIGASRAFCPQSAWIQNASVRDNITFGKAYDRRWYNEVVDACSLRPDLEMLPNGDMTEIGERGITVSGGQKQRLNIARAIYFHSDIILMDDPLSAVDAHVGRAIMDHAICGLMKDKCRILATHQLHVLNRCDRILWLQDGEIKTVGTFAELMSSNKEFVELMASTDIDNKDDDKNKTEDADEADKNKKKRRSKKPAHGLMQAEERAVRSVSWRVYMAYIRASGSIFYAPLLLLLLIASQFANIGTSLFLSWWSSNKWGWSTGAYIGVYAALGFAQALLMFAFSVALSIFGTQASKMMLKRAVTRVLRAPMSFFDTTPLGRITNRFSKDVDVMDNNISDAMRMYFITMAMIIAVFILIIVYFPFFAVALGPLFVFFIFSANFYRASAREIKRHEAVLRSEVFARFSESVYGTASIRAYRLEGRFSKTLQAAIDDMNSAYYLTFSNQRWLSIRLDIIGSLLVFTTSILVVTSRLSVNPATSGLVLSYILSIVQMLQFSVRQLAEVENNMNSTERVHHYGTELEEEPPLRMEGVRESWPERGEIVFQDVHMRYRTGLPLVLQGVTMHIKAGERVGIAGRTGAGKSSILSALFRLVDPSSGSITIDGVDISQVGLHDLRSRLAIIPQDPTLFRGTVRTNLDPFGERTDLELWSALKQADLVPTDGRHPTDEKADIKDAGKLDDSATEHQHGREQGQGRGHGQGHGQGGSRIHLDSVVEEEGMNFSLGQRQLMALARALVRGSQIIVCDEATSSVDMKTDEKIQETILNGFRGKTLLCIAHRLRTVITYDRICIMDAGRIAEFDRPLALYDLGGIFRGMCEKSGIRREDFPDVGNDASHGLEKV